MKDDMLICPNCGEELFSSMDDNDKIPCPECDLKIEKPLFLKNKYKEIVLYPSKNISRHQIEGEKDISIIATVVQNKNNKNLWGIRNVSNVSWVATMPTGEQKTVLPNGVVPILKNIKINFGNELFEII